MNELAREFENSFNENWLPEEMLRLYAPVECLAENSSCTTLILQSREGEEKCIAKCYKKDNIQISVTESEILSSVRHKGLPSYIGTYENDQTVCVLRQYIEGQTLDQVIEGKKCTPDEIAAFALKICDILKYLHSMPMPVLHRDIKPENIIIDENGDVYLIDFGISRIVRDVDKRDTKIAATAAYAPPEQFGFLPTDARSDLYALGVVMNEMLTGSPVLKENDNAADKGMGHIIRKCTAFSPDDRYRSAGHLASDIRRWKHRYLYTAGGVLAAAAALALLVSGTVMLIKGMQNGQEISTVSESTVDFIYSEDRVGENGDSSWSFDNQNGVVILSGEGYITDEALNGLNDIERSRIREIIIEEGVYGIGEFRCGGCSALKKITIPGSAAGNISEFAFADAWNLELIEAAPDKITGVGWIYDITTKTLRVTYNGTGSGAAEADRLWHWIERVDMQTIKRVIIDEGVTSLGFNVFWYHLKLEEIEIPRSMEYIDPSNFADTPALSKINVHPENETYYTIGGALYGYAKDGSDRVIELESVAGFESEPLVQSYIPDTTDEKAAFYTQIDDNGRERIGYIAGENGKFSTSARVDTIADAEGGIGSYSIVYQRYSRVLWFVPRNLRGSFSVAPGTNAIGKFACAWCDEISSFSFPACMTEIGGSAFYRTDSLAEFVIPADSRYKYDAENYVLYSVGTDRVKNGIAESRMTIVKVLPVISGHYSVPETYDCVYINDGAFSNCTALTEVTITDNVQLIGDAAFLNCSALEKVNMPSSIVSAIERDPETGAEVYLGYEAFGSSGITSIDLPYGISVISDFCFAECHNLKEISIPDTVERIQFRAFSNCFSLEEIVLPDSISEPFEDEEDGIEMFCGCKSLKRVVLPENNDFDTIGVNFFAGCRSLETIVIPDNIRTIEENAFSDCGLVSINTNNVELIKSNAFRNCYNLETAKLPNVARIEEDAFANCRALENVEFSANISDIADTAFSGCRSLDESEIPD